jgi:hypothetical protein
LKYQIEKIGSNIGGKRMLEKENQMEKENQVEVGVEQLCAER